MRRASNMLSTARRRAALIWACALLGCLPTARAFSPSPVLRGAAFLGWLYRAYATEGVAKQIVDSGLVFDGGAVASGLSDNDDALQCLRAAIAAVLTTGTGTVAGDAAPWVNTVAATSYTDSDSAMDEVSKVTFSISMKGIDAQTVLDDLIRAVVTTDKLMTELNSCDPRWPYDAIDAEVTEHVLQTETFQRAAVASVGAVISTALVFDSFGARNFNDDSVAVLRFKDLAAGILSAALIQIDNILAEDFYGLDEGNGLDAIHSGTVARGSTIRFDVAVHAWPIDAVVLETPDDLAQVMLNAVVDGRAAGLLVGFAATCDCVLAAGVLNVRASQEKIDLLTLDGTHVVTSPPVPCTDCGGGDDEEKDLSSAAKIAIALAAIFCFLGGVLATVLYIGRRNKFNGCLSPAKRRISSFTGSAELELRPADPIQKEEVRPAKDVV